MKSFRPAPGACRRDHGMPPMGKSSPLPIVTVKLRQGQLLFLFGKLHVTNAGNPSKFLFLRSQPDLPRRSIASLGRWRPATNRGAV